MHMNLQKMSDYENCFLLGCGFLGRYLHSNSSWPNYLKMLQNSLVCELNVYKWEIYVQWYGLVNTLFMKAVRFYYSGSCVNVNFQPETDLFATQSVPQTKPVDIEDIAGRQDHGGTGGRPVVNVTKRKRMPSGTTSSPAQSTTLTHNWRDALGPPPSLGNTKVCSSLT